MKKLPGLLLLCLAALSALVCAGCISAPKPEAPIHLSTPLNRAKAMRLTNPGRNKIIVNAFYDSSCYGDYGCTGAANKIKTCAGNIDPVKLFPATERVVEWIKLTMGSEEGGWRSTSNMNKLTERIIWNGNEDDDTLTLVNKKNMYQKCDSEGFAHFDKIADGDFYVIAYVGAYTYTKKVSVRGGETKRVVLSD